MHIFGCSWIVPGLINPWLNKSLSKRDVFQGPGHRNEETTGARKQHCSLSQASRETVLSVLGTGPEPKKQARCYVCSREWDQKTSKMWNCTFRTYVTYLPHLFNIVGYLLPFCWVCASYRGMHRHLTLTPLRGGMFCVPPGRSSLTDWDWQIGTDRELVGQENKWEEGRDLWTSRMRGGKEDCETGMRNHGWRRERIEPGTSCWRWGRRSQDCGEWIERSVPTRHTPLQSLISAKLNLHQCQDSWVSTFL